MYQDGRNPRNGKIEVHAANRGILHTERNAAKDVKSALILAAPYLIEAIDALVKWIKAHNASKREADVPDADSDSPRS